MRKYSRYVLDLRDLRAHLPKKRSVFAILRGVATSALMFALIFGSILDIAFFAPAAQPKKAEAAYSGKTLRTVEYVLGGGAGMARAQSGTDNQTTARASDLDVYAGSAWNSTKATAGTKTVTISGSGIRVVSAYVNFSATKVSAVDVTDVELALDVRPGLRPNVYVELTPIARNGTANLFTDTSGVAGNPSLISYRADATALFQTQIDAEWNSGLAVVGMASITGGTWVNATMKLVLTYEQDYNASAHTEVKTVRFPTRSATAGDNGSKSTSCSAATCGFLYNAYLPDLATTTEILDVWFEINYVTNAGASAETATPAISGGTAGQTHSGVETGTNVAQRYFIFRPLVGTPNFMATTTQTLNITMATAAAFGLGAELVVTYKYSTGAPTQVETVSYLMGQQTTPNGAATTTHALDATVSNGGLSTRNVWFKSYYAMADTVTISSNATVDGSASTSQNITFTGAEKSGEAIFYLDTYNATTSWSGSAGDLRFAVRPSTATGDSVVGTEAYITFTHNGSAGPTTKTAKFFGGASGNAQATANATQSFPYTLEFPEVVTKTSRSMYMVETAIHTDVTNIAGGTATFLPVASSSVTITEANDASTNDDEDFVATYLIAATTSDGFSAGGAYSWTKRGFLNVVSSNQAEEFAVSGEFIATYDVDLSQTPSTPTAKRLRTVEYVLGGGAGTGPSQTGMDQAVFSAGGTRAANSTVYAGTSWNATKGSAGTKTIAVPGTGIRVVSAYVQAIFTPVLVSDIVGLDVGLDVRPGVAPNTVLKLNPVTQNGTALIYANNTSANYILHPIETYVDATPLFQTQTDAEWNAGLSVVGAMTVYGPGYNKSMMKLVLTYEEDVSATPHTALKTVRYPLFSASTSDHGTRQATAPYPAKSRFAVRTDLSDLATTSDIADVWYEIYPMNSSVSHGTTSIQGGSPGVDDESWAFPTTHTNKLNVSFYRPQIGGGNFSTSTHTFQYEIENGNGFVDLLGGELVVTYKYSTGAPRQVETVRYYMGQETALPGTATTTFAKTVTVANSGFTPQWVWFRFSNPNTETGAGLPFVHIETTLGNSATTSGNYELYNNAATARGGEKRIFHVMDDTATTSWSGNSTTLRAGFKHSANTFDAPVGAEALITFTWDGSGGGTETKSHSFFAGTSGSVPALKMGTSTFPYAVELPESVAKTHRSSYVREVVQHTQLTAITNGTVTFLPVASSSITINEAADATTNFSALYFAEATTSDGFSSGSAISWAKRVFQNMAWSSANDEFAVSGEMVVTYDAAFAAAGGDASLNLYHYRWRNDDGAESAASFATGEDATSSLNWFLGDRMRLRLLVWNNGTGATTSIAYRPEYAQSPCSSGWTTIPTAAALGSEHWVMDLSQYVLDGTASTNVASGLTDPGGGTFVAGEARTSSNTTAGHALSTSQFTEIEYGMRSTLNLSAGTVYCFRLTNSGSTYGFVYTVRPDISISGGNRPVVGGGNIEASGSGSPQGGGGQGGGGGAGGEGGGSGGSQGGGGQGGGGGDSG